MSFDQSKTSTKINPVEEFLHTTIHGCFKASVAVILLDWSTDNKVFISSCNRQGEKAQSGNLLFSVTNGYLRTKTFHRKGNNYLLYNYNLTICNELSFCFVLLFSSKVLNLAKQCIRIYLVWKKKLPLCTNVNSVRTVMVYHWSPTLKSVFIVKIFLVPFDGNRGTP